MVTGTGSVAAGNGHTWLQELGLYSLANTPHSFANYQLALAIFYED